MSENYREVAAARVNKEPVVKRIDDEGTVAGVPVALKALADTQSYLEMDENLQGYGPPTEDRGEILDSDDDSQSSGLSLEDTDDVRREAGKDMTELGRQHVKSRLHAKMGYEALNAQRQVNELGHEGSAISNELGDVSRAHSYLAEEHMEKAMDQDNVATERYVQNQEIYEQAATEDAEATGHTINR